MNNNEEEIENKPRVHFIRNIIEKDLAENKNDGKVITRFPPEPNGYLHIGHAKSIHLNFSIAKEFNGKTYLRFDDTNPEKENDEYMQSIQEDVKWLGFEWCELTQASDYFMQLYNYAIDLIKAKKAYVCDLSFEQMKEYRGTLTSPGKDSPYRNRSVEENLELFAKMKNGEFEEGSCVLRAKIDMASPNINMRDPILYRIKHAYHHSTKDEWKMYPMYDFTHCISDALEGITHSLCTLEFEDHRPLYDWVLDNLDVPCHPQQIEFSRLNLQYTVMSKRKLHELVDKNLVDGWSDPRMPTIAGMRKRGYTPQSLKDFAEAIGISKSENNIDMSVLEDCVRNDLNINANRVMGVVDPIKLIVTNYPSDKEELVTAKNHPQDESKGTREIPFSKELYIERDDFMEDAPRKYFRLTQGREVRLRYAYYVTCTGFLKDEKTGEIKEVYCTYDPETKGGKSEDGRKVKGTIHWVSAKHAVDATVNMYDRLFKTANPNKVEEGKTFLDNINPESLKVVNNCKVEPSLKKSLTSAKEKNVPVQFERLGYFILDKEKSSKEKLTFNRTVTLRDSWASAKK